MLHPCTYFCLNFAQYHLMLTLNLGIINQAMYFQPQLLINALMKQYLSIQLASYGVYIYLYFILQLASQCVIKVVCLDMVELLSSIGLCFSWILTCYCLAKVIFMNATLIGKNKVHVYLCTNSVVLCYCTIGIYIWPCFKQQLTNQLAIC